MNLLKRLAAAYANRRCHLCGTVTPRSELVKVRLPGNDSGAWNLVCSDCYVSRVRITN